MRFEWTYQGPSSTFADTLLVDGTHASGRVVRYRRSVLLEAEGTTRLGAAFYVGLYRGEKVPGEHADLAGAHRAVETCVRNRAPHPAA